MTTPSKSTRSHGLLTPAGPSRASLAPAAPTTPSAAQHHQQSLHETFTVLGELTHEFKNHADECALLAKLVAKKREIAAVTAQKQAAMRDLIVELTQKVADLAKRTEQPPTIGLHQQQVVLHQQKSAITGQIDHLQGEIRRLEAAGADMQKQRQMLEAQKAASEQAKAKQMPAMAGTMGLYRNFSSIAWDYDVDASTTVRGTFHFDRQATIKNFQFDRKQMADFDIANALWDMMETAQ